MAKRKESSLEKGIALLNLMVLSRFPGDKLAECEAKKLLDAEVTFKELKKVLKCFRKSRNKKQKVCTDSGCRMQLVRYDWDFLDAVLSFLKEKNGP